MKYIIGNWKCNKNTTEVKQWVSAFRTKIDLSALPQDVKVIICPSFVHLALMKDLLPELTLGVQTLSPFPNGQYTGAVSGLIVSEFAHFVILGHTERRKFFGETDLIVGNQALQALDSKMTPIIAVDDQNWSSQLSQLNNDQLAKCLVMYEPPTAISTAGHGHAVDLSQVLQALQLIKASYPVMGVLYGGSVNAQNVSTYTTPAEISGVVPGNASLDPHEFAELIKVVAQHL